MLTTEEMRHIRVKSALQLLRVFMGRADALITALETPGHALRPLQLEKEIDTVLLAQKTILQKLAVKYRV